MLNLISDFTQLYWYTLLNIQKNVLRLKSFGLDLDVVSRKRIPYKQNNSFILHMIPNNIYFMGVNSESTNQVVTR